jgi:rod shape-determining protein MreC
MAATRTQKEIRQKAPLWLLMLLVINFAFMAVDARDSSGKQRAIRSWVQALASPFERATSSAGGASMGLVRKILNFRGAAAENEQLKERVNTLELELSKVRDAAGEKERLEGLLNLKEKSGYDTVVTRVIARDPSVWFNTITIGAGSSSGIELNMPVVTGSGIVGRIVALSPWTAQVMLITDEQAAAGAVVGQLGESNALGPVKGMGQRGLAEMRFVSGLEKVEVGDQVLTTGQDGIYPSGLRVGEVIEVRHGTATQPHVIYIRPSARLDQLEHVAVLRYHPPQRPAPDQSLPNLDKAKKP